MINEKYSAGMVKKQTFFREMLQAVSIKKTTAHVDDLKKALLIDNYLNINPARRNQEISSTVLARLASLSDDQINLLAEGSLSEQKQMTMISIMKTERLVKDFINEVYMDKLEKGLRTLEDLDFNLFFRRKAEQNDEVAKWQDVTIKKLRQVMKKILRELDFITDQGKDLLILEPLASQELLDALRGEPMEIRGLFLRGNV